MHIPAEHEVYEESFIVQPRTCREILSIHMDYFFHYGITEAMMPRVNKLANNQSAWKQHLQKRSQNMSLVCYQFIVINRFQELLALEPPIHL